jgi:hypothetical protein
MGAGYPWRLERKTCAVLPLDADQGQILDVLNPLVRQHPEWFEWPRRDVSLADIERIEKHERLEA